MNLYLIKMKINLKIEMITQFYDSLEKSHPLIMKVGIDPTFGFERGCCRYEN